MANVENLKKVIVLGAEALNVGSKIMHGGGLLSLLSMVDEVNALGSLDKSALLVELKDCSPEERKELEGVFKEKLSLENKVVEGKIEQGLDVLEKAILLALKAIALVGEGKSLVEEAKAILS